MTLLSEREIGIIIPHNPAEQAISDSLESAQVAEDSPERKFAKNAVSRFFEWLAESPKNSTYLKSPTYINSHDWLVGHGFALQQDIEERLSLLTFDYANSDIGRIYRLKYGEPEMQRDRNGNLVPVSKMFTAEEIAYDGISDIVKKARSVRALDKEQPEKSFELASENIVKAIGATVVRAHYLEEISFIREGKDRAPTIPEDVTVSFDTIYKQNILSEIYHGGLLQQEHSRLTANQDDLSTQPLVAAQ